MIVQSVTHYAPTNSVEVVWVNETTGENVKVRSYSQTQMVVLRADLGADVAQYEALIAFVESTAVPDETPEQTTARLAAEQEGSQQDTLRSDLKIDAVFTALKTATPAQISTFVNNQFSAFTAQQKATMKMLIQVAALTVRRF